MSGFLWLAMLSNGYSDTRLRFQKHNFKATGDANYNDIKTTSSETVSIIWDRIGLGFSNFNYQRSGNYQSDQSQSWEEGYWIQIAHLSYTFGTNLTLTLGSTVWSQGHAWISKKNSATYVTNSLKPTYKPIISTVIIGFRVSFIEFLIGAGEEGYKFSDFQCFDPPCAITLSEIASGSGVISDVTNAGTARLGFGIGVTF
jgi:hypothetical protein